MNKSSQIVNMAIQSINYELYLSPKPGLVDKNNNGAHSDMDYFTFIDSASSLWPYFMQFIKYGEELDDINSKDALEGLRIIGIEAEKAMFCETSGVNTHKGAIFSMGIILCVIGHLESRGEQVDREMLSKSISTLCAFICEDFTKADTCSKLTHGEIMYIKYGIKGIRGEAEDGYKTVFEIALIYLESTIKKYGLKNGNKSKILLNTLLKIMSTLDDTNILYRHNKKTLESVKSDSLKALELGGMFTDEGSSYIEAMDNRYNDNNISPGGAADLIAVTIFLGKYFKIL